MPLASRVPAPCSSPWVRAKITKRSASPPALEIQVLVPSSSQPSPSSSATGLAVACIAATSLPASGSDSANAATSSPRQTPGSSAAFCASLPNRLTGTLPRPCIAKAKSASASARASVSRASARLRTSICSRRPPQAAGTQARSSPAPPSARTSAPLVA